MALASQPRAQCDSRSHGFLRGPLASMVVGLATPLVSVPEALIFASGTSVASRIFKLNILLIFVVGMAVWALYLSLGGNVT